MQVIIKTAFLSLGLLLAACGSGNGGDAKDVAPSPKKLEKPSSNEGNSDQKKELPKEKEGKKEDATAGSNPGYIPLNIYEPTQDFFKKSYDIYYIREYMPDHGIDRCVAIFENHGSYGAIGGARVVHDWTKNKEEKDFFCVGSGPRGTRRRLFIPSTSGTYCMGSMEFDENNKKIHEYEEVDRRYCLLP